MLGRVRTDPTDTGGLFIRRRPGTAPVRYRKPPKRGSDRRQRADRLLAAALLALMTAVNLLFWGPIPLFGLWTASQVQYVSGSVTLGLFLGFSLLLALLIGGLVVLKRIDHAWILVRRAAGFDQRSGVLPVVFGATAIVGGSVFTFWLLLIGGLGPSLSPGG
jgi:hypothetical protein